MINLNFAPYFDDFDPTKKFYRIIYRPAQGVQVRELNQMQSILQEQISRFGDHFFKQGAMVIPGQVGFDAQLSYVRLVSNVYDVLDETIIDQTVQGMTSGLLAEIRTYTPETSTDPPTLYVKYKNSNVNGNIEFLLGEQLVIVEDPTKTYTVAASLATPPSKSLAIAVGIEQGVYYYNGIFVAVDKQLLLLGKYTNIFKGTVGLQVTETIITEDDDASLLENSQTSPNYLAPGAHRYKIEMFLEARDYDNPATSDFIELVKVDDSVIVNQVVKTDYDVIHQTLARRTKDQWGDYTKNKFGIDIHEHLDTSWVANGTLQAATQETLVPVYPATVTLAAASSSVDEFYTGFQIHFDDGTGVGETRIITEYDGTTKIAKLDKDVVADSTTDYTLYDLSVANRGLYSPVSTPVGDEAKFAVGIEAGKAYVNGYEVELQSTKFVDVDKARTTATSTEGKSVASYGSYLYVKNLHAVPVPASPRDYLQIFIMSTKAVGTYNSAYKIGTADVRDIEFAFGGTDADPSDTQAVFRMYLQNIVMDPGYNIDLAQSFYLQTSPTNDNDLDSWGDIVTVFNIVNVVGEDFTPHVAMAGPNGKGLESVVVWDQPNGVIYTEPTGSQPITSLGPVTAGSSTANILSRKQFFGGDSFMSVWPLSNSMVETLHPGTQLTAAPAINASTNVIKFPSTASSVDDYYNDYQVRVISGPGVGEVLTVTNYDGTSRVATLDASWSTPPTTASVFVCSEQSAVTYYSRTVFEETGSAGLFTFTSVDPFIYPFSAYDLFAVCVAKGGGSPSFDLGDPVNLADYTPTYPSPNHKTFTVQIGTCTDTLRLVASVQKSNQIEKYKIWTTYDAGDATTYQTYTGTGNEITLTATDVHAVRVYEGMKTWTIPFTVWSGSLTAGALVHGDTSSSTGQVLHFDSVGLLLTLVNVTGNFASGETIHDISDPTNFINSTSTPTIVYATPSITDDSIDVSDQYSIDDGQRDTHYQFAKITRKAGYTVPSVLTNFLITFDYFKHVGSGDFFSVDSYTGQVDYTDIPVYTNSLGTLFPLRDCLDFRASVDPVLVNDIIGYSVSYYLNRIDKIFLLEDRSVVVVKGTSSLNPFPPEDLNNGMLLYTLYLDPYCVDTNSIKAKMTDSFGYTMRDIGKLAKRIENLEYYTQLNLLEQDTAKHSIIDATTGLDRYKNGFVVDNFKSHGTGNVWDSDYNCAIDNSIGELRPQFYQDNVGIEFVADQSTGYVKVGDNDILMLPYYSVSVVSQPLSTRVENVNPFTVSSWGGTLDLIPASDEWRDMNRRPDVLINDDVAMQNIKRPLGVIWNEWQTNWVGEWTETSSTVVNSVNTGNTLGNAAWNAPALPPDTSWINGGMFLIENRSSSVAPSGGSSSTSTTTNTIQTTETRQASQTKTGVRTTIIPQVVSVNTTDKIVNMQTVPFIRERIIQFVGKRMKPKTRVYPYFDGRYVGQWVRPTRVAGLTPYILPFDEAPVEADNNALGITSDTTTPSEALAADLDAVTNIYTGAPLVKPAGEAGASGEATSTAISTDRTTPPVTGVRPVPNDILDQTSVAAPNTWSHPASFVYGNISVGTVTTAGASAAANAFQPTPIVTPNITSKDVLAQAVRDTATEATGRAKRELGQQVPVVTIQGQEQVNYKQFVPTTNGVISKVSGEGQTVMATNVFALPLVVAVRDTAGLAIANATVLWNITGPATIPQQVVTTDASGLSRVHVTASAPGTITVSANIGAEAILFNLTSTFNTKLSASQSQMLVVTPDSTSGQSWNWVANANGEATPVVAPSGSVSGAGTPTTVVLQAQSDISATRAVDARLVASAAVPTNPITPIFKTNTTGGDRGALPLGPTTQAMASDLLTVQNDLQSILSRYSKDPDALLSTGYQLGVLYYASEFGKSYVVVGYTSNWQPIILVPRTDTVGIYEGSVYVADLSTGAKAYIVSDDGYDIFLKNVTGTEFLIPGMQITWFGGTTGRNDMTIQIFQPDSTTTVVDSNVSGVSVAGATALTTSQLNDARATILSQPKVLLQITLNAQATVVLNQIIARAWQITATDANNILAAQPSIATSLTTVRTDTSTNSSTTQVQSGSANIGKTGGNVRIDPTVYSLSQQTLAPTATIPEGTAFGDEPQYGDPLYTNGVGNITGEFWIPNTDAINFRCGQRKFRLTSSSNNNKNAESWGDADYTALGTLYTNQRTVTSIREPRYVVENLYDEQIITESQTNLRFETQTEVTPPAQSIAPTPVAPTAPSTWISGGMFLIENTPFINAGVNVNLSTPAPAPEDPTAAPTLPEAPVAVAAATMQPKPPCAWYDPLAETFLVDTKGGYFLTKIDLYFASSDPRLPVTVQIRTVVNGYPSKKILPFAEKTLYPETSAINVSDDGSVPTAFEFPVPIYLEENQEYAFVVLANTRNYLLHTARMGERSFITGSVVSQQPYAGVMFKSQNASTWNADQLEDIKFTIYRAKFDTSATGTVYFRNKELEPLIMGTLPFQTAQNSAVVRILNNDNGMVHGDSKSSTVSLNHIATGTYNGIPSAALSGDFQVESVDLDSYTITANTGALDLSTVSNGLTGPALVEATREFQYDVMHPIFSTMILPGTGINWFTRTITGKSVHNNEQAFQNPFDKSDFMAIVPNTNIEFNMPQMIACTKTETAQVVGISEFDRRSLLFRAVMLTTQDNLSPMIDLQRMSAIVVHNRLDDPTFDNQTLATHDIGISFTSTATEFVEFGGYDKLELSGTAVVSGTTATTVGLGSVGSEVDNYYQYMSVKIISGTGIGQEKIITSYSATTRAITVSGTFSPAPDGTSHYEIWRGQSITLCKKELSASALRGGSSTVNIAGPIATVDAYKGMIVRITAGPGIGEQRTITGYDYDPSHLTEAQITVDTVWLVNPTSSSTIIILSYDTDGSFDNFHAGRCITISGAVQSTNNHAITDAVQLIKTSRNILTCDTTFYPEQNSSAAVLTIYNRYVGEESSEGCSASSRYITKKFTLAQPANSLHLTLNISRPLGSFVDVYYKTILVDSGSHFDDIPYTQMEIESGTNMDAKDEFVDYNFLANEIGEFTSFCFKIVMRGGNSSKVPRIRDLRGIALGT